MISNNACYSVNSSVNHEDCLDNLRVLDFTKGQHSTPKVDFVPLMPETPKICISGKEGFYLQRKTFGHSSLTVLKQNNNIPYHFCGANDEDGILWKLGKHSKCSQTGKQRWYEKIAHDNAWETAQTLGSIEKIADNKGVFIIPNHTNGMGICAEMITESHVVFFEIDTISKEDQWKLVREFEKETGITPALIVDTGTNGVGKSLHVYFRLKFPVVGQENLETIWKRVERKFITKFKSDKAIQNQNREMRGVGFKRYKNGKVGEQVIIFHSDREYTIEEIEAALDRLLGGFPYGFSEWHWQQIQKNLQNSTLEERIAICNSQEPSKNEKVKATKTLTPEQKSEGEVKIKKQIKEGFYPLEIFLSKENKTFVENGVTQGEGVSRNETYYKIIAELKAAIELLDEAGIPHTNNLEEIGEIFCNNCTPVYGDAPHESAEKQATWTSALNSPHEYYNGMERIQERCNYYLGVTQYSEDPECEDTPKDEPTAKQKAQFAELTSKGKFKADNLEVIRIKGDRSSFPNKVLPYLQQPGAVILDAPTAMGKTQLAKEVILQTRKVIAINPTIALTKANAKELGLYCQDGDSRWIPSEKTATTVASLYKINDHDFLSSDTLLVADEADQIQTQLTGSMFDKNPVARTANISELKYLGNGICKAGGKYHNISADTSDILAEYYRSTLDKDIPVRYIIFETEKPKEHPPINWYTDKTPATLIQNFYKSLAESWDEVTNCPQYGTWFFTDSRTGKHGTEVRYEDLIAKYPDRKKHILKIDGDSNTSPEAIAFLENPNKESEKYWVVIVNSAVGSGLSITNDWFKELFAIQSGTVICKMINQAISRPRLNLSKHIWCAKSAKQRTKSNRTDWRQVQKYYVEGYKASIKWFTEHIKINFRARYIPETDSFNSPEFIYSCKEEALQNLNYKFLRYFTKQWLSDLGYTFNEIKTGDTQETEAILDNDKGIKYDVELNKAKSLEGVSVPSDQEMMEHWKNNNSVVGKLKKSVYWNVKLFGETLAKDYEVKTIHPVTNVETTLKGQSALCYAKKRRLHTKWEFLRLVLNEDASLPETKELKRLDDIAGKMIHELMWDIPLFGRDLPTRIGVIKKHRELGIGEFLDNNPPGLAVELEAMEDLAQTLRRVYNPKYQLDLDLTPKTRTVDLLRKLFEMYGLATETYKPTGQKLNQIIINPHDYHWFGVYRTDCDRKENKQSYYLGWLECLERIKRA